MEVTHLLMVLLGLGASSPLSLGRNQSRGSIINNGGGGRNFPLTLVLPLLTSLKIPIKFLMLRFIPRPTLWHVIGPLGLLLGDILVESGGQDPVKSLLLCPYCLLFED